MDPRSRDAIQQLTRDFYRRHAQSFSDSRDHPWPGWERVAERIPPRPRILDVGCGNGRFASFLAARGRDDVDYTGVDQSEALLAIARSRTAAWPTTRVTLHAADVLAPGALPAGPFDVVVLFGVLLHVPGFDARVDLAARLAERLAPGGFLAATLWHFAMDERALRHTVPFDVHPIDVDATGVEPGRSTPALAGRHGRGPLLPLRRRRRGGEPGGGDPRAGTHPARSLPQRRTQPRPERVPAVDAS